MYYVHETPLVEDTGKFIRQKSFWEHSLSVVFRQGLFLEVISLTGFLLAYYAFKGTGIFTYDLYYTTEEMRANPCFRNCLALFSGLYVLGALYIMSFQIVLADDASWARGYRAGSKLLGTGAALDVLSGLVQFVFFLYMATHYDKTWWLHFKQGGVEWTFMAFARLLHSCAMLFYGASFALLELYHDEGTNDWHGCLNGFLFTVAGVSEIVVIFLSHGVAGVVLVWLALFSALVWSMSFEDEVAYSSPAMGETELTNDVENQVEKYSRMYEGYGLTDNVQ